LKDRAVLPIPGVTRRVKAAPTMSAVLRLCEQLTEAKDDKARAPDRRGLR
jgi:hypothetical protein